MTTVRDLSADLARAATEADVFAAARRQVAADPYNMPFALSYLFDSDATTARLAWTAGIPFGHPAAPDVIDLEDGNAAWPATDVRAGARRVLTELDGRFPDLPTGAWAAPPERGLVVPFARPGQARPYGFLVAALNRHRPVDDAYVGFVELIAGQIAAAITRARAFEEERQRVEQLAELDRAKTTFFTNVSHELRTPLTLMLGPAEDALADRVTPLPAPHRAHLETIERNGQRLLKLVNTLLDFSRLESGRVRARFEPLDLAHYTAELASMFESAYERAGLTLTTDITPLPRRVHADREMWAKIVLNLLSNALKATFTGGVTISLRPVDGGAQLEVSDTGVGIPAAEQERLFERFHRVSGASLPRTHEGSGIGLALVAELAALHGGSVSVESELGVGSSFRVRIPGGTEHLPADQVTTDLVDDVPEAAQYTAGYLAEASRWLVQDDTAPARDPKPERDQRPRVLVVDDNADMREYIAGLLSRDYAVDSAADGAAALEKAVRTVPDLVLTDVMMPRLDGFGLLAALREHPATLHLPVVMLSARAGEEATVHGLEAGADDYLVKPFSSRELLARVRANLELDRMRRVANELERSRGLLDQAEQLAQVGSWELDPATGRVTGSAEYYRMFGLDPAEPVQSLDAVLAVVEPMDRSLVTDAVERAVRLGEPLQVELRVDRPKDGRRLMRAHGVILRAAGAAPLLRGSVQDVTDQRAAEYALAAAAAAREAAAREHEIAEELQRSLLPAPTVEVEDLQVATYYRAGVEGTQVGGDWYDVIELGGGRTALVLGDVMGRGVRAAAVMGQLRATVRAYARLDLPPGDLLALLDDAVRGISEDTIVTCVYAVYDPAEAALTYGNAGHLPPLLVTPGRPVQRLACGDPPLGTGRYGKHIETVELPAGSTLAFYTDGLVEHRGSDLDNGIEKLAASLAGLDAPLDAVPSLLVDALLPSGPDDDVALLVASVGAAPDREKNRARMPIDDGDSAVAAARHFALSMMRAWGVSAHALFDVQLLVSELVTNARRHGRPPAELRLLRAAGEILIEVHDCGSTLPTPRNAGPAEESGRGLRLIAAMAERWGTRPDVDGKSVWCTVRIGERDS
jgi:signal transduction histidine kinase/DNA-binding response OmpR family regulator/anti-sigma regulatory factor (Ser/Thr protein kinase)